MKGWIYKYSKYFTKQLKDFETQILCKQPNFYSPQPFILKQTLFFLDFLSSFFLLFSFFFSQLPFSIFLFSFLWDTLFELYFCTQLLLIFSTSFLLLYFAFLPTFSFIYTILSYYTPTLAFHKPIEHKEHEKSQSLSH